jgi:hypothetical protein
MLWMAYLRGERKGRGRVGIKEDGLSFMTIFRAQDKIRLMG